MQTLQPTLFFGSGPVAAASLERLIAWHPVAAVITKRTPAHHKEPAPIETLASRLTLPLLYADTRQELDTLELPTAPYGIVIDYGVIISEQVIRSFPLGIINSHFSILPEWRGADPITYAILSGQATTGVSIMLIDKGLDTGPLLAAESLAIDQTDTTVSLTKKLIHLSDTLLHTTLPQYANYEISPAPQAATIATYSQKLSKQSGSINPLRTATELAREVRAFAGWPNSRLVYNNVWLTITQAVACNYIVPAGSLTIHEGKLLYGCKGGSLTITELQPAGKNKMDAPAFINGYAQKLGLYKA